MFSARRFVVVGAYGVVLETEDGGASWSFVGGRLDNPKELHLNAIRRAGDVVVIVGEQGLILRSDDGGRSFRRIKSPYQGSWFSAEVLGDSEMVLMGLRGNVWSSGDAGKTWRQVHNSMPVTITASARRSDGAVLLANQAGFVLELRDDRVVEVNPQPVPALNGLLALDRGSVLGLTVQGAILVPPQIKKDR